MDLRLREQLDKLLKEHPGKEAEIRAYLAGSRGGARRGAGRPKLHTGMRNWWTSFFVNIYLAVKKPDKVSVSWACQQVANLGLRYGTLEDPQLIEDCQEEVIKNLREVDDPKTVRRRYYDLNGGEVTEVGINAGFCVFMAVGFWLREESSFMRFTPAEGCQDIRFEREEPPWKLGLGLLESGMAFWIPPMTKPRYDTIRKGWKVLDHQLAEVI